jgi:alpha-ribazole phosphatase
MEIYIARHIKPLIEEGICYGQKDVPVPEIIHTFNGLPATFDVVYSSPLVRCTSLAKQLSGEIITDARLMELHFGDWEGLKWNEIDRTALDAWGADYINLAPPDGESLTDLVTRLAHFLNDLRQTTYATVIIVAHSGIIRCANHLLKNVPLQEIMNDKIDFGSVHHFQLK